MMMMMMMMMMMKKKDDDDNNNNNITNRPTVSHMQKGDEILKNNSYSNCWRSFKKL